MIELSNKLQLRVTKSIISAYKKGIRMPSYDILVHIAEILNVSTDYLLRLEKRILLTYSD